MHLKAPGKPVVIHYSIYFVVLVFLLHQKLSDFTPSISSIESCLWDTSWCVFILKPLYKLSEELEDFRKSKREKLIINIFVLYQLWKTCGLNKIIQTAGEKQI